MENIFIITDTHFGHKNIIRYDNRPEKFEQLIIQKWNEKVNYNDIVIHLGDVCLAGQNVWDKCIRVLNGKKILVKGNHDSRSYRWYMKNGFDFVCEEFIWNYCGKRILFSHHPKKSIPDGIDLHIHGHVHNKSKHKKTHKSILITPDYENYAPILLEQLINIYD